MAQQLSVTLGVAAAAALVELAHYLRAGAAGQLVSGDFRPAFLVIALLPVFSAFFFSRLPRSAPTR